jgi:nucleoside-diphosphate-sugar epimerase
VPPVLVTGSSGLLGRQVVKQLHARNYTVCHVVRNINNSPIGPTDCALEADITIPGAWQDSITRLEPTAVIHCAGHIRGTKEELWLANVEGLRNLISALGNSVYYILASTGAVYGDICEDQRVNEEVLPRPLSDYAYSKLAQESVLSSNVTHFAIMRISNLVGSNQSSEFFIGRCVNEICQFMETNDKTHRLTVGDLAASRDFIDCRDAATAMVLAVERRPVGVFNLSSGQSVLLSDVLKQLIRFAGLEISVEIDHQLGRNQIRHQCLDNTALHDALGWLPSIKLEESLKFALASRWGKDS